MGLKPSFAFYMNWNAANDMRLSEVMETMLILKEAFGFPDVYTEEGPFPITEESFCRIIEKKATKTGLFLVLPAYRQEEPEGMAFRMVIGSPSEPRLFRDYLILNIRDWVGVDKLGYMEKCVDATTCAEAFVSDWRNEEALNFFDRDKAVFYCGRPGIIRWWHYMDNKMVKNLGGLDFCLKAPAWRVRQFPGLKSWAKSLQDEGREPFSNCLGRRADTSVQPKEVGHLVGRHLSSFISAGHSIPSVASSVTRASASRPLLIHIPMDTIDTTMDTYGSEGNLTRAFAPSIAQCRATCFPFHERRTLGYK